MPLSADRLVENPEYIGNGKITVAKPQVRRETLFKGGGDDRGRSFLIRMFLGTLEVRGGMHYTLTCL